MVLEPLISCKELEKKYHGKEAIYNINFSINKGRVILIAGPSGSGKTTLIDLISGLIKPSSGKVIMNGYDVFEEFDKVKDLIYGSWETNSLYPTMSIIKNLSLYAIINGFRWSEVSIKANQLLKDFGLYQDKDKFITNLSPGMQRKADICRAFLLEKKVLFLDEPSSLVDNKSKKKIVRWLLNYKKNGSTIIIATHHLSLFGDIADELIILKRGKLFYHGSIKNLVTADKNHNSYILKTTDRIKANELLEKMPNVKSTYVSQKAVHILLHDDNIFAILESLSENNIETKKIVSKKQNLDKIVQVMLNES
jgi:ABC-2 type transport system ATP-binding protein